MIETFLLLLYNLSILAGTVYLIIEYEWSTWWMLLAVLLLATSINREKSNALEDKQT